ncbi:hypothetical protein [Gramella sp. KN1008]|uniref:hypothetical protein n=1 Tax=Gramella sp. KN1008 TaxID=2529298 RepID=UPI0010397CFE|nr:hypothetical protein [Gramella sp. KN1008]TBW30001.1 hypothetical protein EZJ28_00940 [Gramella sp. KN1008]
MMKKSHSSYRSHRLFKLRTGSQGRKITTITSLVLLILPLLFLTGVIFKHYLKTDLWIFTSVYEWIILSDQKYGNTSPVNWIIRFLLLGGPFLAFFINFLFVFEYRRSASFSMSYKWINLLLIISGAFLCLIFLSYLIMENMTMFD